MPWHKHSGIFLERGLAFFPLVIFGIEWGSLHTTPIATLQWWSPRHSLMFGEGHSVFPSSQPGSSHPTQPTEPPWHQSQRGLKKLIAHWTFTYVKTHQNRFSIAISVSNSCTSWRKKSNPETTLTYALDTVQGYSSSVARLFSDLSSLTNPPGTSFSTCKGRRVISFFFWLACLFQSSEKIHQNHRLQGTLICQAYKKHYS